VKNITISVDEVLYRRARIKAAERDSSISALVKNFLIHLTSEENIEFERLKQEEQKLRASLRASGSRFSAADRLSRDELYNRHAIH
jgi:hypothetical protein